MCGNYPDSTFNKCVLFFYTSDTVVDNLCMGCVPREEEVFEHGPCLQ